MIHDEVKMSKKSLLKYLQNARAVTEEIAVFCFKNNKNADKCENNNKGRYKIIYDRCDLDIEKFSLSHYRSL